MAEAKYWEIWSRRRASRRAVLRASASVGLGLSGLVVLACSTKPSAGSATRTPERSAPQPGGTYRVITTATVNVRPDPQTITGGGSPTTGAFSRPFRFKTGSDLSTALNYDLENDLAISVESPDATTWTLKLRPDAKFHDIPPVNGHAVEAEDVKATFLRAATKADNPNREAFSVIDLNAIQTPAKDTVVIKLKAPFAPFLKFLASPVYAWILPREALAGAYDLTKLSIGSGPFITESYQPDVTYVSRRSPDWYEKGRPYVDEIETAIIPDTNQQLAQFRVGNLDELVVSIDSLDSMRGSNPQAQVITRPSSNPGPIFFQLGDRSSVFQDIRIRQAFSMAIDRDAIAKSIYANHFQVSVFLPLFLGKWALNVDDLDTSTRAYYQYNPAEAKKLLAAAGASDLEIKYAWVVNGSFAVSPTYQQQAEAVNNMLAAIGIKTTPVQQDFTRDYIGTGNGSINGHFPRDTVLFATVKQLTDPDDYLYPIFHSGSSSNAEMLSDSTLDPMLEQSRTVTKEEERLKVCLDIQKYLAQKLYVVATGSGEGFTMVQPRVGGYAPNIGLGVFEETYSKLWLQS